MQHINYVAMPGPGDIVPPDTSLYDDARARAIGTETEAVLTEWLADRKVFSEYLCEMNDDELAQIDIALESRNAKALLDVHLSALRRVMADRARQEAEKRVDDDCRQAKIDAAEERALSREGWDG